MMNSNRRIGFLLLAIVVYAGTLAGQQTVPAASPTPTQRTETAQPAQSTSPQENAESDAAQLPPTNDPKEIVRRATEMDHHNFEKAQKYTCTQREVIK